MTGSSRQISPFLALVRGDAPRPSFVLPFWPGLRDDGGGELVQRLKLFWRVQSLAGVLSHFLFNLPPFFPFSSRVLITQPRRCRRFPPRRL